MDQAQMEAGSVVPIAPGQVVLWLLLAGFFALAWWVVLEALPRLRRWWRGFVQHRRDVHNLWVAGAAERDRKRAADLAGRCGR